MLSSVFFNTVPIQMFLSDISGIAVCFGDVTLTTRLCFLALVSSAMNEAILFVFACVFLAYGFSILVFVRGAVGSLCWFCFLFLLELLGRCFPFVECFEDVAANAYGDGVCVCNVSSAKSYPIGQDCHVGAEILRMRVREP